MNLLIRSIIALGLDISHIDAVRVTNQRPIGPTIPFSDVPQHCVFLVVVEEVGVDSVRGHDSLKRAGLNASKYLNTVTVGEIFVNSRSLGSIASSTSELHARSL